MVEGMRVEFKREYAETIRKTVVAFANTEGGTIYIGIDDDGCIVGVDDPDDVQKKVVSSCHDGIAPDIMPFFSCNRTVMDGKDVIVVDVGRGTSCPYYLQNKGIRPEGVYVRRGSASNIKAFESTAKKYNIDFSLKKVKGEQTRYLVFFKGRDADVMTAAFQEFSAKKLNREKKPSIRKALAAAKDKAKQLNAARDKVKKMDRGREI